MPVIYPPTLDWDYMVQRPQQLMRQFAHLGQTAYFCNRSQQPGRPPEQVEPNLWVVRDHAAFLAGVVPGLERPAVWCSWARLHDTLTAYRPGLVVYDCVDDFPQWRRHEPPMLARADAVTTTSLALFNRLAPLHPRVSLVPNGCDYDHFAAAGPAGSGRVAVFVGAWAQWVDTALVEAVAHQLPDWTFRLIGPRFGARVPVGANLQFLDHQPYADLPRLLAEADVALIPFKDNQVTRAANPIKLWEYLAAGLPVVATPLPELEPYRHLVTLAAEPSAFAEAVRSSPARRGPAETAARQALARASSWEARCQAVLAAIPELSCTS